MGLNVPEGLEGQSLVPEVYGETLPPRPILLDLPVDTNNPERRALVHGGYKLIVLGSDEAFQLYDLIQDPKELQNLAKVAPDRLEQMKAVYRRVWGRVKKVRAYGGVELSDGSYAKGPTN
jgi:arylsulfatase A-like enzyme